MKKFLTVFVIIAAIYSFLHLSSTSIKDYTFDNLVKEQVIQEQKIKPEESKIQVREIYKDPDGMSSLGSDNYIFPPVLETPVVNGIYLEVVLYDSLDDLRETHKSITKTGKYENNLIAFTEYDMSSGYCIIHMVDPSRYYLPEFYGHELMHCLYGPWHPE